MFDELLRTHVGEGVLVSVGVGHGEEVEVDLVDVAVGGRVLHHLPDDVRAHRRGDPFPRVDACKKKIERESFIVIIPQLLGPRKKH